MSDLIDVGDEYGPVAVVARLLADPLRRAWLDHIHPSLDDPERDRFGRWPTMRKCCVVGGIAHCPEAMWLFALLPVGDQRNFLAGVTAWAP